MSKLLAEFDEFHPQRKLGQISISTRRMLASRTALNLLKKKAVPIDQLVDSLKKVMKIADIWWLYIGRTGNDFYIDIRTFHGDS